MAYAMRELLEYYVAAGVDCALEDEPQDRFAETAAALAQGLHKKSLSKRQNPPAANQPASIDVNSPTPIAGHQDSSSTAPQGFNDVAARAVRPAARVPNEEVIASARALAEGAKSLEDLQTAVNSFDGCNLKKYAKNTVFADGNPQAKIMFVGEAPGREEDISGKPFTGPAGQLLDRMLACVGIDRTTAYFANILPWRPPGNRSPTSFETGLCRPFVERQIELVDPDILVLIGAATTKVLTGKNENIVRLRGRWTTYQCNDRDMLTMPIFHPEYLLKAPAQKRLAWQDLLTIKRKLEEASTAS